ncbi:hypothetical protein [Streptomyces sp. NPDC001315]|uniref:hypothetical protein n=1 Tax=Streptomyces sp. NPDC001315 TaxID=3364562 RepID=UPI00368ABD18
MISTAEAGHPHVKALVYVPALMPDVGRSGMTLSARFPSTLDTAIVRQDMATNPDLERFKAMRTDSTPWRSTPATYL